MILVSAYLGFARHNVKKTSERLNALKELNNTTEFMPVEAQYRYYLRSDTKLEYEEFSLPKFFRREVRENFKLYNTLLGNARANTVLYKHTAAKSRNSRIGQNRMTIAGGISRSFSTTTSRKSCTMKLPGLPCNEP